MRFLFTSFLIGFTLAFAWAADSKDILSPDGKIKVSIEANLGLRYAITYEEKIILQASTINLVLRDGLSLSGKLSIRKLTRRRNNTVILSPVPEKRTHIPDLYNELTIRFNTPFSVVFRVYNAGKHEATICEDGINADRYPSDYTLAKKQITKDSTLTIRMAPGGGNLVRLRKIQ